MSKSHVTVPAEWANQKRIWTAWPALASEWNDDLAPPRTDIANLIKALSAAGNTVMLLVNGDEAQHTARAAVGKNATLVQAAYGDVWLRDTGPIFAKSEQGPLALRFKTNGWGGKYHLPGDDTVGDEVAAYSKTPVRAIDFVLEGGAIDQDGDGTILATRETLLNPNRNGWTEKTAETALAKAMGTRKIIWIDEGLNGDHTDGHVDNIARFVAPGRVVCQAPAAKNDPNAKVLDNIARALEKATDANGRKLEVIRIPGAGQYVNAAGELSPASHMNFVIANNVVVVPVYGTPTAESALRAFEPVFPGRKIVGVSARGLLGCGEAGGGSFHCITQQEPLL